MDAQLNTSHTLIGRAINGDSDSWEDFVQYYKKFIYGILHKINVPEDFKDDATQEILLTLWSSLPKYSSEKGRFRNWLATVIHNRAVNCLQKNIRQTKIKNAVMDEAVENTSVGQSELEEIIMKEWQNYLSNLALDRVRPVFRGMALESFVLTTKGCSADEVAEKLGITVNTVYSHTKRVKNRMKQEMKQLINELEF